MKRMWIVGYAILILNLLIGCGTPKEEVKEVVQESEVGVEEVQKEKVALSEQELQELFQLIYEQSGGRNANTEEQKVLELEALGKITPPEEKIFPEDVNERYTRWRGDVEKAQREELEQKYWEMVSGLTVYEYSNMSDGGYSQNEYSVEENSGGLLYADAVDMDGNGVVELLTISVKKESYGDGLLKVGVYGMQGNIVAELETMEIPWSFGMGAAWGINGIDICQRDEKVYIGHWFDYSGGGGMRTGFEYYGLEKEGWSAEKLLYELNWENPNDPEHTYLRNEEAITAGEYEEILNSYQSISLFTTDYGSVSINEEARGAYVSRLKELEESLKNRQIRILVDGKEIAASAKLEDKTVLIPICETFDAMGIQVIDNAEEGMFIATTRKNSLKFHNMWAYSILDFCDVYMDEELQDDLPEGLLVEKDGVLFLPLTMLERFWGAAVSFNKETATVTIDSNIPVEERMSKEEIARWENFEAEDAIEAAEQNGFLYIYHALEQGYTFGEDDYFEWTGYSEIKHGQYWWYILVADKSNNGNTYWFGLSSDGKTDVKR